MFRIYLTNLGKYNEGVLAGEWVDLPCEDFAPIFERIGINDRYEEMFITDYENDYGFIVNEYDTLDYLNGVAAMIDDAINEWDWDADLIRAVYEYTDDMDDALALLDRGDWWNFDGCDSMEDVAYRIWDDNGTLTELQRIGVEEWMIDWDAVARDYDMNGIFLEYDNGYVEIF